MGGSSSKPTEEVKNDLKDKDDQNATNYKEKKDSKEISVKINSNDNNNTNNDLSKKEKEKDDISNDIEELTLDKNGVLINEKDIVRPTEKKPSKKLTNHKQNHNINNANNSNNTQNQNHNQTNNIKVIPKEKEEKIIVYTEKESQKLITNFYDDFIEILYCYNSRKTFIALAKSLNEKYLYKFNSKKFPKTKESQEFLETFKYSSIIIACFIFLVKDFNLYENSGKKIKENLEQFIFSCLDNVDRTIIFSLKIISYVQRYRKIKKSLFGCTSGIIKTLFKNKTSYKHIMNCLEQILSNINTDSTQDIIVKINESILFCYNASTIINSNNNKNDNINGIDKMNNTNRSSRKKSIKKIKIEKIKNISKSTIKTDRNILIDNNREKDNANNSKENTNNKDNNNYEKNNNANETIMAPFIKKEMDKDKKFCLVLDIDETLSHMIKLPFGNYFLVRPGVIDLLKELYSYYEIDIFTAALKHYADNIINKLDRDNIYISYRLYRCHCTYEEGKSVKKLSLIGRDLNKIVFVDDLKRNAKYNMKNLALVSKWIDNVYDNEIINLKNKLKFIAMCGKYDEDITQGLIDEKLSEDVNG
jgi:hypothetical protein